MNTKEAMLTRAASLVAASVELGEHADALEFDSYLVKLASAANDGRSLLGLFDVPSQKLASDELSNISGGEVYKHLCEITGDPVKAQAIMAAAAEDGVHAELSGELGEIDDNETHDDVLSMSLNRVRSEAERRDSLGYNDAEPRVTIKDINQPLVP